MSPSKPAGTATVSSFGGGRSGPPEESGRQLRRRARASRLEAGAVGLQVLRALRLRRRRAGVRLLLALYHTTHHSALAGTYCCTFLVALLSMVDIRPLLHRAQPPQCTVAAEQYDYSVKSEMVNVLEQFRQLQQCHCYSTSCKLRHNMNITSSAIRTNEAARKLVKLSVSCM
jgi:hypothetical protein